MYFRELGAEDDMTDTALHGGTLGGFVRASAVGGPRSTTNEKDNLPTDDPNEKDNLPTDDPAQRALTGHVKRNEGGYVASLPIGNAR